jgi:pyruvate dehydrogenase complex dehydrogenase (E1) component
VATLSALAREGKVEPSSIEEAMKVFNINPDKSDPAKS